MKKHLLRISTVITLALFSFFIVGGAPLFADCPGGTMNVQVIEHEQDLDENGCLVSYTAGGYLVYCPSTGMVLEDQLYWYESMRVCD